jgi:transcriptional regulator with XRE-family HTH domain
MNDWAEIRRLSVAEGLSQRAIAERLSLSRVTVARALTSPTPPTYSRVATSSKFVEVADSVRALLEDTPSMPASVLAERVGREGSPSWFRK